MGKRVLLVGHDFFNFKTSGDKNYWLALVSQLIGAVEWIGVLSINHLGEKQSELGSPDGTCTIFNIEPVYFATKFGPESVPFGPKCATSYKKPVGAIVDGPLTIIRHGKYIKKLVSDNGINTVHFMDNFGFAARILKLYLKKVDVAVTFLGMYSLSSRKLRYKSIISRGLDAIVLGSEAMNGPLRGAKLESGTIRTIPWAADTESMLSAESRSVIRNDIWPATSGTLILWTGYTQQLGESEYWLAIKVAEQLLRRGLDAKFVFLFKPECFRPDLKKPEANENIIVMPTEHESFQRHLLAADLLLAPISRSDTVVTPPLTWIESMLYGTPIVSNEAPGVSAALGERQLEQIAETVDVLADTIAQTISGISDENRAGVEAWARERYCIKRSAKSYAELWESL